MDQNKKTNDDEQGLTSDRWQTDYMCQEKEEVDSPTLKIASSQSIRGIEDYIKKCKERLITVTRNSTDRIKINRTAITRK